MQADIHIDDFCRDSAMIIAHLYKAFPLPFALYVEDIYGPEDTDEVGLHSRRYRACLGTMLWLAEEGIIRYETMVYQQGIDQAILSNNAFSLLTSQSPFAPDNLGEQTELSEDAPNSLMRESHSWIGAIRSALQSSSSEKITVIIQDFLRHINAQG